MHRVKIDLLRQKYNLGGARPQPVVLWMKILLFICIFGATAGAAFSFRVAKNAEPTGSASFSLFSSIRTLVQAGDRELQGQREDRINFLLLGVGGAGHEGPQLSDTTMLVSYRPSDGAIGLLSIPRDLTVPIPGYGWRKINAANAYGEAENPGKGPELAARVLSQVLDTDIHYYIRMDFNGFAKLIDDLNGIDVYVDRAFTDNSYPVNGMEIAECDAALEGSAPSEMLAADGELASTPLSTNYDCRFEMLSFTEGWTRMDGNRALKFVRSRHGTNGEASDFARARRQQKILLAAKDKLLSASTLLNPIRINRVMETLQANIATNFSSWEVLRLAQELKKVDAEHIASHVLDASPDSPLYATSLNGAYVLLPKKDDWGSVQRLVANLFEKNPSNTTTLVSNGPAPVRIELQNGTTITGLASRVSRMLENNGYAISKISNTVKKSYAETVIYDFTNGQRMEELKELRRELQANITLSASGWLVTGDLLPQNVYPTSEDYASLATTKNIDFLVILGNNAANVLTP